VNDAATNTDTGGTPADGEAARWQAARQLGRDHPRWVVIWLARASEYRAYALFRTRATVLAAPTPQELASEMERIEQAAPARGTARPHLKR
jgi:hypothetical protein